MAKPSVSLVKDWYVAQETDRVQLAVGSAVFDQDYWRLIDKKTKKKKYFYGELAWSDSHREADDLEWRDN